MDTAFAAYAVAQKTVEFEINEDLLALVDAFEGDVNAQFLTDTFAGLQAGVVYKDICLVFVRFLNQLPENTRTYLVRKFIVIAMTGCGNNQIRALLGPAAPADDAVGRAIYERWLRVADASLPAAARSRVQFQMHDPQFQLPDVVTQNATNITYNQLYNQFETEIRAIADPAANPIKLATKQLRTMSPLNPKLASIIGSYLYMLILRQRLTLVVNAATANTFNALMVEAKFQAGAGFVDDRTVVFASNGGNVNVVVPVILGLMAFPEAAIELFPVANHGTFLRRLFENSYGATIGVTFNLNHSGVMNLTTRERHYVAWDAIVLKARTVNAVDGYLTNNDPTAFVRPLCFLKAQRLQGQLVSQVVDDGNAQQVLLANRRVPGMPVLNQ